MLEVPNTFTMIVPDGWSATRNDGTYELTKPGDDGAAHVSVYDRSGDALGDDEAERVLATFISRTGVGEPPPIRVLRESNSQHRAVATFTTDWDGQAFSWLAFVVLWRERMLICSCNASPGSTMLGEAEQMFASIFKPKRKLFGRK